MTIEIKFRAGAFAQSVMIEDEGLDAIALAISEVLRRARVVRAGAPDTAPPEAPEPPANETMTKGEPPAAAAKVEEPAKGRRVKR